jgi:tetratricopeptide (TPR) repeat protein
VQDILSGGDSHCTPGGIPVLATAQRLDPANPAWRIGLALLLSSLHRHAEAVAVFEQVLAFVPLEYAHHHALASALLSINRFSEALAGFEAAIAPRPDAVESHLGRGEALRRLCRYEDALNAYDQAISVQKDCANAWHDLHCPMMSLPFLLGRDLNTIPAAPYLRADPRIAASWLKRLPHSPGRPRWGSSGQATTRT